MSKCTICGKAPTRGNTISHSHRATGRTFNPNVKRVKILVDNKVRRTLVCTSCIRSGKVKKAVTKKTK
jgi:large subunit ribosomal protein L28